LTTGFSVLVVFLFSDEVTAQKRVDFFPMFILVFLLSCSIYINPYRNFHFKTAKLPQKSLTPQHYRKKHGAVLKMIGQFGMNLGQFGGDLG
jgi:hypothetical protein